MTLIHIVIDSSKAKVRHITGINTLKQTKRLYFMPVISQKMLITQNPNTIDDETLTNRFLAKLLFFKNSPHFTSGIISQYL